MCRKLLIPSLIVLFTDTNVAGAAEGGVDVNPDENASSL